MSGRSGAISHTTLHEATKGNRLPSWETTVEFVRACGADPAAYRERWERANLAVRSAGAGDPPVRADTPAADPGEPAAAAPGVAPGAAPGVTPSAAPGVAPGAASGVEEGRTAHTAMGSQTPRLAGEPPAPAPPPPTPPPPPGEGPGDVRPAPPAPGGRGRFRTAHLAAAALAAAVVGMGAAALITAAVDRDPGTGGHGPSPSPGPSKTSLSAADCPVRAANPPWGPPAHKGDSAVFIGDITLPDCTRVGPGQTRTKVWRLKNAGTVPWKGYSLHRLDPQQPDQCRTASDVPIKDTRPGKMVDVRTDVTAPGNRGFCYVRFKMMDGAGRVAFPGGRPLNFQVVVE
ncbi:NBR1-Ig-like domain-containing protein [Streptosporangium sp. NPDC050855]|uniref:NBR1-Ig-like domain-containing protein n=1 Tax=Streptosporangium sp. NPDC050855 TaxID=3366194 RepID=UPI0037912857